MPGIVANSTAAGSAARRGGDDGVEALNHPRQATEQVPMGLDEPALLGAEDGPGRLAEPGAGGLPQQRSRGSARPTAWSWLWMRLASMVRCLTSAARCRSRHACSRCAGGLG